MYGNTPRLILGAICASAAFAFFLGPAGADRDGYSGPTPFVFSMTRGFGSTVARFKAGEPIYARSGIGKTSPDSSDVKSVYLKVTLPAGSRTVEVEHRVPAGFLRTDKTKDYVFEIVPAEGVVKQDPYKFVDFLSSLPPGHHTVSAFFYTGAGTATFELDVDAAGKTRLEKLARKLRSGALGSVTMPKSLHSDSALSRKLAVLLGKQMPKDFVVQINLHRGDWVVERHAGTGTPIRKKLETFVAFKRRDTGACWAATVWFAAEHAGRGFGPVKIWGRLAAGADQTGAIEILCENVGKVK